MDLMDNVMSTIAQRIGRGKKQTWQFFVGDGSSVLPTVKVPNGAVYLTAICHGGGGGGGADNGGGGGGGGGCSILSTDIRADDWNTEITMSISQGGAGAAVGSGNNGSTGGATSITSRTFNGVTGFAPSGASGAGGIGATAGGAGGAGGAAGTSGSAIAGKQTLGAAHNGRLAGNAGSSAAGGGGGGTGGLNYLPANITVGTGVELGQGGNGGLPTPIAPDNGGPGFIILIWTFA
jgi:hypothetical protein